MQIKGKLEIKEKVRADSIKFEREQKLRALPKLQITPFTAPQDWLSWVANITSIVKTYSKEEISSPHFLSLSKTSINIEEGKKYCRNLDDVHLIISYLKGKYLTSGRMIEATLQPIETIEDPKTIAIAITNAETVVRILKLLEKHKIEDQLELSAISLIENKTVRKMDQENYFSERLEKIKETETPRPLDNESTRVGEV